MKKIFALLMAVLMVTTMLAGCNDDVDPWDTVPTDDIAESTEPTKSAEELALEEYIYQNAGEKVLQKSINISYKDKSADVTPQSELSELGNLFPTAPETIEGFEDVSTLTIEDPDIMGVNQRLSYKRVLNDGENDVFLWSFFADSHKDSDLISWIELDPLSNYSEEEAPAINGVSLSTSFKSLLSDWGTPDVATLTLKDGKSVVIANWVYEMGDHEGHAVCVYVCISGVEGTNFDNAVIHDIYINPRLPATEE